MPRRTAWIALTALLWCGCSRSDAPTTSYDSTQAKETLLAALDAWKAGQIQSLARRTPPIRFVDDDLMEGRQLVDYKLENPDANFRPYEDVRVELSLRKRGEPDGSRAAIYQVSLEPVPAVLRCDH